MRILPVGNFAAFDRLAGAFKLPRRAFVLGNMLGLVPGLLGLGMIGNRLMAVLRRPGTENSLYFGLAVVPVVTGLWFLRRRYRIVLQVPRE